MIPTTIVARADKPEVRPCVPAPFFKAWGELSEQQSWQTVVADGRDVRAYLLIRSSVIPPKLSDQPSCCEGERWTRKAISSEVRKPYAAGAGAHVHTMPRVFPTSRMRIPFQCPADPVAAHPPTLAPAFSLTDFLLLISRG